jgi:hypothetical protein
MAGVYGGFTSSAEFIDGAQRDFISYCLRIPKTLIFSMLLATIPSFHGYYMKGGALEVGKGKYCLCLDIGFYNIIQLYINAIVTRIMIEIKDIEKSFGETKILKGISTILKPEKRT